MSNLLRNNIKYFHYLGRYLQTWQILSGAFRIIRYELGYTLVPITENCFTIIFLVPREFVVTQEAMFYLIRTISLPKQWKQVT